MRNGYLPERTIKTGLGDITSQWVLPYLKRTKAIGELLPWLYLRGISTGDFPEALQHLLSVDAKGLSANTMSRLKSSWKEDYKVWTQHLNLPTTNQQRCWVHKTANVMEKLPKAIHFD